MAMLFGRPEEAELAVERTRLDETCPRCAAADVRGYPLLAVSGWCLVARCQSCLHVLRSEPSPTPFGFSYLPYSAHLRGF